MILDSVWLRPCDVRWQWLNPHSPLGVAFSAQNERKRCSCTVRSSLNWSPWRFSAGNRLGIPNFQWFWKFRNSRKIWKFGKISKFKQDLEILWYFRWCCVPCIDTRGKYMILESNHWSKIQNSNPNSAATQPRTFPLGRTFARKCISG